jgi:hypothetical protein
MGRDRRTRTGARAPGVERQEAVRTEVLQRATSPGTERGSDAGSGEHEGRGKLIDAMVASRGKALSDQPTLKPYWGKPAVRNFREGNGNVGIMRSPLRAIALPDQIKFLPAPVTIETFAGSEPLEPSSPWRPNNRGDNPFRNQGYCRGKSVGPIRAGLRQLDTDFRYRWNYYQSASQEARFSTRHLAKCPLLPESDSRRFHPLQRVYDSSRKNKMKFALNSCLRRVLLGNLHRELRAVKCSEYPWRSHRGHPSSMKSCGQIFVGTASV